MSKPDIVNKGIFLSDDTSSIWKKTFHHQLIDSGLYLRNDHYIQMKSDLGELSVIISVEHLAKQHFLFINTVDDGSSIKYFHKDFETTPLYELVNQVTTKEQVDFLFTIPEFTFSLMSGGINEIKRLSQLNQLSRIIKLVYEEVNLSKTVFYQKFLHIRSNQDLSIFNMIISNEILMELFIKQVRGIQDNKEIIMNIITNDLFYINDLYKETNLMIFCHRLRFNVDDDEIDLMDYSSICDIILSLKRNEIFNTSQISGDSALETLLSCSPEIFLFHYPDKEHKRRKEERISKLAFLYYPWLRDYFPDGVITQEKMEEFKNKKTSDFIIDIL